MQVTSRVQSEMMAAVADVAAAAAAAAAHPPAGKVNPSQPQPKIQSAKKLAMEGNEISK